MFTLERLPIHWIINLVLSCVYCQFYVLLWSGSINYHIKQGTPNFFFARGHYGPLFMVSYALYGDLRHLMGHMWLNSPRFGDTWYKTILTSFVSSLFFAISGNWNAIAKIYFRNNDHISLHRTVIDTYTTNYKT